MTDEDCISRQSVLNALCNDCELYKNEKQTCFSKCEEYHFLVTLPSVQPKIEQEPKTGYWQKISADKYSEHVAYYFRCSECGKDIIGEHNYCPNCGCRMGGSE